MKKSSANRDKVLIVDDEVDTCNLLSSILKQQNLHTGFVNTLSDAVVVLKNDTPSFLFLDNMLPDGSGLDFIPFVKKNYPQVKVLALSMFSDENTIIRMLCLGAKGYILKNIEPEELKLALDSIMKKDFYLSDYISGKIISGLHKDLGNPDDQIALSEKEKEFLRLVCSELTYKDIAEKMFVSHRTVDNYRNTLFEKLKVRSRVGLVMYAIRQGLDEK